MTDYKDQLIELLNEKVRRLENEKESQRWKRIKSPICTKLERNTAIKYGTAPRANQHCIQ